MPQGNVELVRLSWDAYARGDVEALTRLFRAGSVIVQPPEVPDAKSYEGHAAIAHAIEDWPRQWEDFRLEVVEVIEVNDSQLVSVTRQYGRGRESGIEMEWEIAFAHTLEDGEVTRLEMFMSREKALAALGASE